jgi:hypothetical protein
MSTLSDDWTGAPPWTWLENRRCRTPFENAAE